MGNCHFDPNIQEPETYWGDETDNWVYREDDMDNCVGEVNGQESETYWEDDTDNCNGEVNGQESETNWEDDMDNWTDNCNGSEVNEQESETNWEDDMDNWTDNCYGSEVNEQESETNWEDDLDNCNGSEVNDQESETNWEDDVDNWTNNCNGSEVNEQESETNWEDDVDNWTNNCNGEVNEQESETNWEDDVDNCSDYMSTVGKTPGQCDYKDLCIRFMESLNLPDGFFDKGYDRCYCNLCHNERGDTLYYTRGQPPKDYGLPIGWYRFALKMPPKAVALKAMDKWHRAFHGTKKSVLKILEGGELLMPGDVALGGHKIKEREGHFTDEWKPTEFDTKKIFVSPSIRYAGHNAYSTPSKYFELPDKMYIAKVAFQVLIEPASYEVGEQTIGETSQIDPKFSNQEIEWSTAQRGSTILSGLLVKVENAL